LILLVRNRAKEIAELLSDVEKIRTERRRAKVNKNKYGGTGGGFGGSGSRYGGFGSQETGRYGGSSDRNGTGNGYDSGRKPDYDSGGKHTDLWWCSISCAKSVLPDVYRSNDGRAEAEYDEYDAGDDDDRTKRVSSASKSTSRPQPSSSSAVARPSEPPKKTKAPVVQDLFDFGDDEAEQIQTPAQMPHSSAPGLNLSSLDDGEVLDWTVFPARR
jgi:epsin